MRKIGFTGFFALTCLLFIFVASGAAQPKITFDKENHDFGELKEGTSAKVVFEIKNSGTEPLKISRIRSSCGCTASKLEKEELAPGETTGLEVDYISEKTPGEFDKQIYVCSNDPSRPNAILNIFGFVQTNPRPQIFIEDRIIELGEVKVGDSQEISLKVENKGEKPLQITKITDEEGKWRIFEGEFQVPPDSQKELKLKFKVIRQGEFKELFKVHSNDPYLPEENLLFKGIGKEESENKTD